MKPLDVALTPSELLTAATVGVMRQMKSASAGMHDRFGADSENGWTLHIEGAAGEKAFAKALGMYFGDTVNTFKAPDVGNIQVRTRLKHNYDLIVRDNDEGVFALVTGTAPNFKVWGWIDAAVAKQHPGWKQSHGGRTPAWFVPKEALTPFSVSADS